MAAKRKRIRRKTGRKSAQRRNSRAASVTPRFEAFAVGLAAETLKVQRARARSIAREIFPNGSDIEFLQQLRDRRRAPRDVTITPRGATRLTIGAAWERARALESMKGVRYAEPLFRGPGLEPEPRQLKKLLAPHERAALPRGAKAFGSDKPLPCAAQNVLWSLDQIRAPQAWAIAPPAGGLQYGEGISVGHPDTGYRPHEEIWSANPAERRVHPSRGYDFEDDDADPLDPLRNQDSRGHGTATASVIMSARASAQERTVVGVAPSAELVPIRVSDSVVHLSFKNVTHAIRHAVDHAQAHVISMSLGGPFYSRALEEAVDYAIAQGAIVLAAAGNVWPSVVYPARLDQVIAVAACNCLALPWSDSASGAAVDITAPGETVWRARSEKKNGTVLYSIEPSSGTSYAVANVAGACATWLAFHGRPALLAKYGADRLAGVFRTLLTTHGFWKPNGWDTKRYGAGILDVEGLLRAPLPPAPKMAKKALFPRRSRQEDTVERIAGYFPDLTHAQVRSVLATSFAPQVRGPARRQILDELGPELVFHVASNAELRARLHARAQAPQPKRKRAKAPATNPLSPAKKHASPTLRRALEA